MIAYSQPGFSPLDIKKLVIPGRSCLAERDYLHHLTNEELLEQGQKTEGWGNLQWSEVARRLRNYDDTVRDLRKINKSLKVKVKKLKDAELQEVTINNLRDVLEKFVKEVEAVKRELDVSRVELSKLQEMGSDRELEITRSNGRIRELDTELEAVREELNSVRVQLERFTSGEDVVLTKNTIHDFMLSDEGQGWLTNFLAKDGRGWLGCYIEADGQDVLYDKLTDAFMHGVDCGVVQSVDCFAHLGDSNRMFPPNYYTKDMKPDDPQRDLPPLPNAPLGEVTALEPHLASENNPEQPCDENNDPLVDA